MDTKRKVRYLHFVFSLYMISEVFSASTNVNNISTATTGKSYCTICESASECMSLLCFNHRCVDTELQFSQCTRNSYLECADCSTDSDCIYGHCRDSLCAKTNDRLQRCYNLLDYFYFELDHGVEFRKASQLNSHEEFTVRGMALDIEDTFKYLDDDDYDDDGKTKGSEIWENFVDAENNDLTEDAENGIRNRVKRNRLRVHGFSTMPELHEIYSIEDIERVENIDEKDNDDSNENVKELIEELSS